MMELVIILGTFWLDLGLIWIQIQVFGGFRLDPDSNPDPKLTVDWIRIQNKEFQIHNTVCNSSIL
jgi:hypothetical protein